MAEMGYHEEERRSEELVKRKRNSQEKDPRTLEGNNQGRDPKTREKTARDGSRAPYRSSSQREKKEKKYIPK